MARKVDLPRVWEVAFPHPDIFSGDLDPARFAISLNAVDLGQGAKDYVEPDRFFQKTFEHSVGEEEIKEEMLSQLEAEERKEVEGRIRERQEELQQTIRRAYTRLFRPRPPEGVEEIHTRRRELVRAETIAEYAWEVLKGEGRLVEKLSPEYLLDKVWTERESGELSYQRLLEAFWQQPGLPLLASEEVLREAIAEGQRKGLFGVIRRDKTTTEVKTISAEEVTTAVAEGLSLVTREKAGQIVKEVPVEEVKKERVSHGPQVLRCTASLTMLYPLRELLNKLQGLSGKLVMEIEVEGELPEKTRHEIKELLQDYKVPFELKEQSEEKLF